MNETKCECDFCGKLEEATNRLHLVNDNEWKICELCMYMMHKTDLEGEEE